MSEDLEALKTRWLGVCGACDVGMGECTHPDGDYRPVMLELVREVERLRPVVEAAEAWVAAPFASDDMRSLTGNLVAAVEAYQRTTDA